MAVIGLSSNIASLQAQRALQTATKRTVAPLERLASGLRIRRPVDDASGLAIANETSFNARIRYAGVRNLNDAMSALSIAQGAVTSLGDISIRLTELAEQAASGSLSNKQRSFLDKEAAKLIDEYNRILKTTTFNDIKMLDGQTTALGIQAGYGTKGSVLITFGKELGTPASTGGLNELAANSLARNFSSFAELADMNDDGIQDLIWNETNDTTIGIKLGNGDGSFGSDLLVGEGGGGGVIIRTADIDGDGDLDVAGGNLYSSTLRIYRNDGTGVLTQTDQHLVAGLPDPVFGDWNGDGVADLAVSDRGGGLLSIFLSNRDGTFTLTDTFQEHGAFINSGSAQVDDVNGDGNLDLWTVSGDASDGTKLYYGRGDGTFSGPINMQGGAGGSIALDVDGDGRKDFVTGEHGGGAIRSYLQQNDGSFSLAYTSPGAGLGQYLSTPLTADFNEDGRPDILLQLFSVGDGIAYFENTGNGQFANPVNIGGGVLGGGPHLARDWDGDGHTDIVGLTGPAMNLYRGDGKGNFTAATPAAYSTGSNIFLIGDLNGDELDDVVAMVAGATSLLSLLSVVDPERSVTAIDPSDFEMSTIEGARHALDAGRRLTDRVARGAAEIGASMSRLETAVTATSTMRDNEIEAASRIMDVDVAEESAALGASRILQQASVAVLAQANAAPELVLRLLNVD